VFSRCKGDRRIGTIVLRNSQSHAGSSCVGEEHLDGGRTGNGLDGNSETADRTGDVIVGMIGAADAKPNRHTADAFGLFVGIVGVRISENRIGKEVVIARAAEVCGVISAVSRGAPIKVAVAGLAEGTLTHIFAMPGAVPPTNMRGFGRGVTRGDVFAGVIPNVAFGGHAVP